MPSLSSDLIFPPFRLDLQTGILWHKQQHRQLRPQVVALLHYLFIHAGLVVTKEEILTALWPGTTVGDGLLKTYIWEIRQALGEKQSNARFIETIPRRGYRFIGTVVSDQSSVVSMGEVANSQYSVVRSPSSPPAPSTQPLAPSLVGRELELTQLHTFLTKAQSNDRQMVCITGEAGIGKTSLVDTFLRQAGADAKLWIARGRCVEQYGAGEAYLPVLEAFGRLGREPGRKRLLKVLHQHAPSWLAQLPSLISPEERAIIERSLHNVTQERMLREITDALEVLTIDQPLLLVLEDLHWSDPSTLELMAALARRREQVRLLVLITYRPVDVRSHSLLQIVAEELQKHGHGATLSLPLLGEEAVREYLTQRFAGEGQRSASLQTLSHAIYLRTEGNPLFMRQTVDYLATQGAFAQPHDTWVPDEAIALVAGAIPHNIQQLIEQQLGRLSTDEYRLLEAASVVGVDFSTATIAAAVEEEIGHIEQWCDSLVRRHLFLQSSGPAPGSERRRAARYRFLHSLYSQVLYARLTPTRRQQLHHVVGESLVTTYGNRSREFAGALANHFTQAHAYAQAVKYYEQAAHKALQLSAPQEAVAHLTRSLEQLSLLPVSAERDQQELGLLFTLAAPLIATKGYTAPESEAVFSRARDLCRQAGDTYRLFVALLGVWGSVLVRGQIHYARRTAEELLEISHAIGDSGLQLSARMALGMPLFYVPDLTAARSHLEHGIGLYDAQQHSFLASLYGQDPGVTVHAYAAWTSWMLGYPDQARQQAIEARALAQAITHPYSLAFALMFGAWVYALRRESQPAQEWATAAMQVAAEHGFPYLVTAAKMSYGWARAAQGDTEEGILSMRESLDRHHEKGEELGRPYDLVLLAYIHQQRGELSEAFALCEEAFTVIERTGERVYEAELYRLRGELTLQKSSVVSRQLSVPNSQPLTPSTQAEAEQEAEGYFLKAIAIAQQQHAKSLELRAVTSLVRLRQRQALEQQATSNKQRVKSRALGTDAALAEAHTMLSEVYNWFTEGFETADLQEASALLAELSH